MRDLIRFVLTFCVVGLAMQPGLAQSPAQPASESEIAALWELQGTVMADRGPQRLQGVEAMQLKNGDRVLTGKGSGVKIVYKTRCLVESEPQKAKEEAQFACEDYPGDDVDHLQCVVYLPEDSIYTVTDPNVCAGGLFLVQSGVGAGAIGAGVVGAQISPALIPLGAGIAGAAILLNDDDDNDDDSTDAPISPE